MTLALALLAYIAINAIAEAECERLRYAVDLAARVMGGEGVEDQGEAWDKCKQILDQACAERAAINAARKP